MSCASGRNEQFLHLADGYLLNAERSCAARHYFCRKGCESGTSLTPAGARNVTRLRGALRPASANATNICREERLLATLLVSAIYERVK
jgi:hypothetical protein